LAQVFGLTLLSFLLRHTPHLAATLRRRRVQAGLACALGTLLVACAGGNDNSTPTPLQTASPTPIATPLPPDPSAGTRVFQAFVDAVQADDIDKAWSLYAASVQGTTDEHNAAYGCDFGAFSYEFPLMRNLFLRTSPFEVTETYGTAAGSLTIELRLRAADESSFLGTVVRVHPLEEYRVQFLNSGEVAEVLGAPDPQPSPGDPIGACGIWAGPR